MESKQLGVLGERIASDYLEKRGYQILDKNYSSKWVSGPLRGEIDIIAKPRRNVFDILRGEKDDSIHFIEVKTLIAEQSKSYGFLPEEKVNFQKQRKLIKIAQDWLSEKKIPLESKWQIDVMAIKIDLESKKAKIRHIQNAVEGWLYFFLC